MLGRILQGQQQQQQRRQRKQQQPRLRKPEWMCGVCGTFNWLDRATCRNCGTQHTTSAAGGGKGASKGGGGKGNATRSNLDATVQAARAAGATEATVQSLKQESAQAKQEKQTVGARLDSATATVWRARTQLERAEEALANAQRRREEAQQALDDAEEQLAKLKDEATGPANFDPDPGSVVAEARALLEVLENSPLYSTVSNAVVPERLLTQMRKLRQTLDLDEEEDDALAEHLDTADELEDRLPGRCPLRSNSGKRASSAEAASRRRLNSSSKTPPPTLRRNG